MRKILLSLTAASAIVSAASLVPVSANAMTVGTASGVRAAIEDASVLQDVRYVCRHRHWRSGRYCYWTRGYRRWYRW